MKALQRVVNRLIFVCVTCSGCVTDSSPPAQDQGTRRVQATTLLPQRFVSGGVREETTDLVVAPYILMTGRVVRQRAEVRVGPGAQFEVLEGHLDQGVEVVVLAQHGAWVKTIPIHDGPVGWVHQQALSRPRLNTHSIHLRSQRLPVIQVVRGTDRVWLYGKNTIASAKVPRGAMFRTLRLTDRGALVWIPETNSVVWLSRKDVM